MPVSPPTSRVAPPPPPPVFGDYVGTRPLYATAKSTVWAARLITGADDGAERFAVKSFRPGDRAWRLRDVDAHLEAFAASAALQRRAAGGSRFWAPVHDHGVDFGDPLADAEGIDGEAISGEGGDGSAYAVTDRYARSARHLAPARSAAGRADALALTADRLGAVVGAALAGLADLRDLAGRQHGNLKSSNVLIAGGGPPAATGRGSVLGRTLRAEGSGGAGGGGATTPTSGKSCWPTPPPTSRGSTPAPTCGRWAGSSTSWCSATRRRPARPGPSPPPPPGAGSAATPTPGGRSATACSTPPTADRRPTCCPSATSTTPAATLPA